MKRIGLFGKFSRPMVKEIIEGHVPILKERYSVSVFDFDAELPPEMSLDLAVVFGGDGTILHAARFLAPRGIPAIGVNLGKFGFLAGCVVEDCVNLVEIVMDGRHKPIERTMLAGTLIRDGKPSEVMTALNDIVITASVPTRMLELHLSISGSDSATVTGDGLIISSATGSTGYNLSSGGPIVTPWDDVIILTALAPHTLAIRPMVISGSEVVEVKMATRRGDIAVTADGQTAFCINSGDSVRVSRTPYRFKLYEGPTWSFYKVLRTKLRWGEEPKYATNHH